MAALGPPSHAAAAGRWRCPQTCTQARATERAGSPRPLCSNWFPAWPRGTSTDNPCCKQCWRRNSLRWTKEISGFPGGSVVKNLPANAGDAGSIPRLGRSPGEGNGYPIPRREKPGMLQPMGSQRVGCNLATKQQQQELTEHNHCY